MTTKTSPLIRALLVVKPIDGKVRTKIMSYPIDMNDLQYDLNKWTAEQFKGQPLSGKFAHLRKEIAELEANPSDLMEYADCYMLLVDIAGKNNIQLSDIHRAAGEKLVINKNRTWGEPNDDGSVEHVRN